MHQVYLAAGTPHAAWGAAVVAASIKLVDLIAPVRLDFVINPAVSILLEGAAVSVILVFWARSAKKWSHTLCAIVLATVAWRGLYLIYAAFVMPPEWRAISPLASTKALTKFVRTGGVANILCTLAYAGVFALWSRRPKKTATESKPGWWRAVGSVALLAAAIVIQLKL